MSAIDDLSKAKAATYGGAWTWEPHGDGWALYVDRDEPIIPELPRGIGNEQHGLNILSVDRDGFDAHGEPLRAFILEAGMKVPLLAEERDAERKAWARLLRITTDLAAAHAAGNPDWARIAALKTDHALAKQALRDLGVDVDASLGEP